MLTRLYAWNSLNASTFFAASSQVAISTSSRLKNAFDRIDRNGPWARPSADQRK
jgi:hypothetical protein